MNRHKEYLEYIESTCLRCHSCRCYHSTSLVGKLCYGELATLLLHNKTEELEKSIFGCHQCGMCLKKCPRKFNAKEFMFHARAWMEARNGELCGVYSKVRVDKADNMFAEQKKQNGISYEDALLAKGECPRLFVPGCHMSSGFPELTGQVTEYLKEKGIADGMTAVCCGNPLYASGLYQEFENYVVKMDQLYREHGVKVITTPCPSCYDFNLRIQQMGYLEGVEVHCLSQDLVEKGIRIRRDAFPENYTVSVHDSCPDRKNGIFAESIRRLYEDFEIIELSHIRENSLCCGCGGLVPLYSSEISGEGKELKKKDCEEAGSECVITTCFNCYKGLRQILPIHQYLADLMEGER